MFVDESIEFPMTLYSAMKDGMQLHLFNTVHVELIVRLKRGEHTALRMSSEV